MLSVGDNCLCTIKESFQLIHCDIWVPAPSTNILGFKWFLIFEDDFSRFDWINLLRKKSKVTTKVKQFIQMIDCQFER